MEEKNATYVIKNRFKKFLNLPFQFGIDILQTLPNYIKFEEKKNYIPE